MDKLSKLFQQKTVTLYAASKTICEYCEAAMGSTNPKRKLAILDKKLTMASDATNALQETGCNSKYHIRVNKDAVWTYLPLILGSDYWEYDRLMYIMDITSDLVVLNDLPGRSLSVSEVTDILNYLDEKYDFSNVVFFKTEVNISIIDETVGYICAEYYSGEENSPANLFLFATPFSATVTPTSVMFEKMGSAVHFALTGDFTYIPDKYQQLLQSIKANDIFDSNDLELSEVYHLAIALGLMAHSKYADENDYYAIPHEVIDILSEMVMSILREIDVNNNNSDQGGQNVEKNGAFGR